MSNRIENECEGLVASVRDGWNKISSDYQRRMGIPTDDVYWGDFVATERQLGVLGSVEGKRVLEIGCGGAQNSIVLSEWGAETCGIDLSRRQILYGCRLAKREGARVGLTVGNVERLPFRNRSFDVVTTAISLFYVPDLEAAVAEVNRVLVENGYFTFSTCHPLSEMKLVRYRGRPAIAIRDYFNRRIVHWVDRLPDGSRVRMHSYYRTLQDQIDILTENRFVIERYIELERLNPRALHVLDQQKLQKSREARQLYKMMKKVPCWIIFKARKA